jgi:8-oxo-dGTP pyrophosphatase MutT (NUDIX family)
VAAAVAAAAPRIDELDDDGVFATAVAEGYVARHEATVEALLGPGRAALFSWRAFLAAAHPPEEGAADAHPRVAIAREAAALQAELGCALDRAAALDAGANSGGGDGGADTARPGDGFGSSDDGARGAPPGLAVQGAAPRGGVEGGAACDGASAGLEEHASTLAMMGFDEDASWNALALSGGDFETALAALLAEDSEGEGAASVEGEDGGAVRCAGGGAGVGGAGGGAGGGADGVEGADCVSPRDGGTRSALATDGVPSEWIGSELPPYCCVVLHAPGNRARFLFEHRGEGAGVARGQLTCFGGKRERDERPLDCVIRECREELGWAPTAHELRTNGIARLIVDGALVAWFFRARSPPSTAELAFEQGRSAVWAPLSDARISPWHWSVLRAMERGEATAHYASPSVEVAAETAALLQERAALHRGADAGAAAPPATLLERALVACPALREELEIARYICETVVSLVGGEAADGGGATGAALDAMSSLLADAGLRDSERVAGELIASLAAAAARRPAAAQPPPRRAGAALAARPSQTVAPCREEGAAPVHGTAASDAIVSDAMASLIAMGFERYDAERALNRTGGDAAAAVAWLLGG